MRRAVGLLLGAVALAVVAGAMASLALFALAVGLLVVVAAARASVALAARRLVVTRWILQHEAQEDQTIGVCFQVRRLGRLPLLPVRLEAQTDARGWVPLGECGGTLQFTVGRRGAWQLASSQLRLRDAFGLFERLLLAGQPEPLLILPAPDLTLPIAPRLCAWATDDEAELDGLQPYTPGTPIGRIHWPALAHGAGLQQRRLAPPPTHLPLVVVDTTDASDSSAVDWAARVAAGAILQLIRDGGCRVLLPDDAATTTVTTRAATWHDLHRRLALLAPADPAVPRVAVGMGQAAAMWIRAASAPAEVLGTQPRPLPPGVVAVASKPRADP